MPYSGFDFNKTLMKIPKLYASYQNIKPEKILLISYFS